MPAAGCAGPTGAGATSTPPGPATTRARPPTTHEHTIYRQYQGIGRYRLRHTGQVSDAFVRAINNLDEQVFQALYGRRDPLEPARVAELFAAASLRWWVA